MTKLIGILLKKHFNLVIIIVTLVLVMLFVELVINVVLILVVGTGDVCGMGLVMFVGMWEGPPCFNEVGSNILKFINHNQFYAKNS